MENHLKQIYKLSTPFLFLIDLYGFVIFPLFTPRNLSKTEIFINDMDKNIKLIKLKIIHTRM